MLKTVKIAINYLKRHLVLLTLLLVSYSFGQNQSVEKVSADRIKSRLYININNGKGGFKQMGLAYVPGATTGHDRLFDSQIFASSNVIIYSINGDYKYGLEGRPYTILDNNETIPLGYVAEADEAYQISIDRFDGNFDKKEIFLHDKEKDSIHNLSEQAYVFDSLKGIHDERFEVMIRDKAILGMVEYNATSFSVVLVQDKLVLLSDVDGIDQVEIISVLGVKIWDKKYNSVAKVEIDDLIRKNQILVVRVLFENGMYRAKKVLF